MKQEALLVPENPRVGDVRVMIHDGDKWLDLTPNVKQIDFVSYSPPWQ